MDIKKSHLINQYLDTAPIVVYECLLDKNWTMIYINSEIEKLSGYTPNDFIRNSHRSYSSIIFPEDQSMVEEVINEAVKNNTSYELKYRIVAKDKSIKWVIEKGKLHPETGNLLGYILDYTNEYLNIQKISEQKVILDSFFENGLELLIVIDAQANIIKASHAFCKLLGYSHSELFKLNVMDIIHPDDVAISQQEIIKLFNEGYELVEFKNRYICKDKTIRNLEWHAKADNKGFIYAGAKDITEKLKTNFKLSQVLNAIETSAIVVNTDKNGIITECNDNFLKISGYDRHEIIGQNHRIINSRIHPKSFFQEMWNTIKSGKVWTGDITNRNKNGSLYIVQTVISPMYNAQKEIEGYFAIRFDVTKEKEVINQLANEKLKFIQSAKLASLGELSASIAHEINNPMAIILGTLPQLLKIENMPDTFKKKILTIQKAGDRISRIVRGLQKYSRSSDKVDVKVNNLSEIIAESIVLCDIRAKKLNVKIINLVDGVFEIHSNELQIEQVLINMINNGVDAVKNEVEKWVKISIKEDVEFYKLFIEDSGNGINGAVVQKIFDPFFTTKKVGEGTGLGLSIVKGILKEHHAKISVIEDHPNTCFEIIFLKARTRNVA